MHCGWQRGSDGLPDVCLRPASAWLAVSNSALFSSVVPCLVLPEVALPPVVVAVAASRLELVFAASISWVLVSALRVVVVSSSVAASHVVPTSVVVTFASRAVAKLADVIAGLGSLLESVSVVEAGVIIALVLVASRVGAVGVLASGVDVEAVLILAWTVVGRLAAVLSVVVLIGDLAEGLSQRRASSLPLCADWVG